MTMHFRATPTKTCEEAKAGPVTDTEEEVTCPACAQHLIYLEEYREKERAIRQAFLG